MKRFISLFSLLCVVVIVTAQTAIDTTGLTPVIPELPEKITVDWVFNTQNGLFSILLYVIVYLSGFIPGLKKIGDKRLRALIVGITLGAGVIVWQVFQKELAWQDFAGLVISFIGTQLSYIFLLSPIPPLKTPEPEKAGGTEFPEKPYQKDNPVK